MTLDKAIKELSEHSKFVLVAYNPDLKAAVKLGIEALKRLTETRATGWTNCRQLLPGETKK